MKIRDISTRKKTIVYTDKQRKKDLQLQQHKESLSFQRNRLNRKSKRKARY